MCEALGWGPSFNTHRERGQRGTALWKTDKHNKNENVQRQKCYPCNSRVENLLFNMHSTHGSVLSNKSYIKNFNMANSKHNQSKEIFKKACQTVNFPNLQEKGLKLRAGPQNKPAKTTLDTLALCGSRAGRAPRAQQLHFQELIW